MAQADIAGEVGVSCQAVSAWIKRLAQDPQAWWRRALGCPGALFSTDKRKLEKLLLEGAVANGFPTELWTLARVAKLISREFAPKYGAFHLMRLLCELGFSCQRP